jgi:hypothetical protein
MDFTDVSLKVLKHELGHWLMARHVGFRAGGIDITIHRIEGLRGTVSYSHEGSSTVYTAPVVKSTDDLKDYLEKRFQVLYAGIAAQIHGQEMTPDESGQIMELDAGNDLRIIRELAPLLRGLIYGAEISPDSGEEQMREMLHPSWEKTQSLIGEFYPKIEWMANALAPYIERHGVKYPFNVSLIEDAENRFVAQQA